MLCAQKPEKQIIEQFLNSQQNLEFSYEQRRLTFDKTIEDLKKEESLKNWNIDNHRIEIGQGLDCYERAIIALRQWKMFELQWVSIFPNEIPIQTDQIVCIIARNLGFWSLNACKIVYVFNDFDENQNIQRFGFAYGTLPGHVEKGEERFMIEYNRETNIVTFEIVSFSLPNHWLVRFGWPVGRYFQNSFAQNSLNKMFAIVNDYAVKNI
eukprot:TRINITY_DN2394_c2_g1_i1.p1 TRINITY_DN2394_c2_g1~~TRINITY_DN2394_c2_g1_i1.p1  ORF type:complete len:210 (-),score=93.88 TRINITY_DN2394_c2_g1_i1:79-708(-)